MARWMMTGVSHSAFSFLNFKSNFQLDRAALMVSADAVLNQHVDLRSVERAISSLHSVLQPTSLQNRPKLRFGFSPIIGPSDALRHTLSFIPTSSGWVDSTKEYLKPRLS